MDIDIQNIYMISWVYDNSPWFTRKLQTICEVYKLESFILQYIIKFKSII